MSRAIRKLVVVVEEIRAEGGRADEGAPLVKAAAAAVIDNPYAGRPYAEDLAELVGPSPELGALLGARLQTALGAPAESYGKAALVGAGGEQEHAVACITTPFGNALREALGGGRAWLSSFTKRAGPGAQVDVPLAYKNEIWVRSHYDGITVGVTDAPGPGEIVVIAAAATRGRMNARLGGMTAAEAEAGR